MSEDEEDEDEGYNSSDDPMDDTSRRSSIAPGQSSIVYRRASDLVNGGACVSKRTRVRNGKNSHRRTAITARHSERS